MTPTNRAACLMLLSGLPSAGAWSTAASVLYGKTIEDWDDELGLAAVQKACETCEWRPAPAKLIEIAVQIALPAPSQSDTREAMRLAVLYHGRKAARASTPFLCSVVEGLGGWPAVCATASEEIDERFSAAYKSAVAGRCEQSIPYLSLPAEERNIPLLPSAQSIEQNARMIPPAPPRQLTPKHGERGPKSQKEILAARLLGVPIAAYNGNSTSASERNTPPDPARRRF